MNNLGDIKATLATDVICYHESYIKRALKEMGYSSFPKSGLNNEGKSKLINKIIDISENEASLKQKRVEKTKKINNQKSGIKKEIKGDLVSWMNHCHNFLDSPIFETSFPLLRCGIAISKFPPADIINVGNSLLREEGYHLPGLIMGNAYYSRFFIKPNKKADTKLWLQCCFWGDCLDWSASSAFFNEGKLIGVYSIKKTGGDYINKKDLLNCHSLLDEGNLKEIYKYELNRVAKEILGYDRTIKKDILDEMVKIINSRNMPRKSLPKEYRESIKEILE